jgi:hypothetical protein
MSDERRYQDHEIREILELAERGDQARVRSLPAAGGLSAAELQEVGRGDDCPTRFSGSGYWEWSPPQIR